MVMVDELISTEKLDEQTRAIMKKGLKHLRKVRDEEKAAQELLEEVQERRLQLENEMWKEVDDYIFTWETREHVLRQFWQSFVVDSFDLDIAIQTKAEFFYAIAVMDKIGGWEEEDWVGSRFAAGMFIYTKSGDTQRSKQHAELQAIQILIHHGSSELGVR